MDLGAEQLPAVLGVEAVALGEEVLERAGPRVEDGAVAAVRCAEGLALVAAAVVDDVCAAPPHEDVRVVVGQPVEAPCGLDHEAARRVEGEEPDPGLTVTSHVRADVELAKVRCERQRQQAARPQSRDGERRHAEPAAARVLVHVEPVRHDLAQPIGRDAVMDEEQVVPRLAHHPGRFGQRPRPVVRVLQRRRLPDGHLEEVADAGIRDCRGGPAHVRSPRTAP